MKKTPSLKQRHCHYYLAGFALMLSSSVMAQCPDVTLTKVPLFGDLHTHSSYSFDAFAVGTSNDPWDAYGFAKKEKSLPLTQGQNLWIDRPLDFAAVTDHAELLGQMQRNSDNCSADGHDCPNGKLQAWQNIQQAANDHYDECSFTTFIGYEYSKQQNSTVPDSDETLVSMLHRNVIFRNTKVPIQPFSFFQEATPQALWSRLDKQCIQAGNGCDVIAIPHNSNLSNGFMFPDFSNSDNALELAQLQRRFEPLVEIIQHKGASECQFNAGLLGEEECNFEYVGGFAGLGGGASPQTANSGYVRSALKTGLKIENSLGVNPYQLGFIGSTDNHNATPGAVSESGWEGFIGDTDDEAQERLSPDLIEQGSGGLAVVWAEQNTRDSIFDSLQQRETYATSGPRMIVRTFGSWDLPEDICTQPQWLETAYEKGVPMGGDLGQSPKSEPPIFVISAMKDSGGEANNLERLQVVKGWTDSNGNSHERVYDVYGNKVPTTVVNLNTCAVQPDVGFASACLTWTDPDFVQTQNAFYYTRVLEVPSCRWSQMQANDIKQPHPQEVEPTIRERAWTSPIWVAASEEL